jgi:iron complex transport system substrate-binding protein
MRWFMAGFAAFALSAAGCVASSSAIGGKPREIAQPKVVSLSPSTTELVAKSAVPQALVGRTASCNFPMNIQSQPIVMAGVKPDFERIAASEADYAVYDADLFSEADLSKLKEIGVEPLPFKAKTLDEFADFCYQLGRRIGGETTLSEYVDSIMKKIAEGRVEDGRPKPRALFLTGSEGEYLALGKGSLLADIVVRMNGEVVGPDADRWSAMNAEAILAADPQVIVCAGNASRVLADPRLAGTSAVKAKLVVDIDGDILLRSGQRMDQLVEAIGILLNRVK